MSVIGTAGHVDHGKSSLIEALTGVHPDRLREEQERGLTIELGFGWMTLPSGREVSIVDVPGHVRFVRHMLAGVGAIDLVLFVIAADEGIMPQTREHLEILDLLGVDRGIVVLTKCDLVEDEWTDLVEEEVRELIEGTALAGAPLMRVSSVTRAGLDELRIAIDRSLLAVPEADDIGRPRLGIDRVFTMAGFGTVVTGTLLGGRMRVGDTLEAVPGGRSARVRGLQTHRRAVDEALPGTRVAVNLAGVAPDELGRGQVLAPPGRVVAARRLDAAVRVLEGRPLRHNLRVALHLGTAEVQARVRVMGGEEIAAGEEGWCQLLLREPVAAVPGDLFVLRVSDETIAGGRVIEANPPRHRRHDPATVDGMRTRAAGTPESRLLATLERHEPVTADRLVADVEMEAAQVQAALAALVTAGDVRELAVEGGAAPLYITTAGLQRRRQAALRALDAYHDERPLRFTMPREELRSRLGLGQREFGALLESLRGEIDAQGDGVARRGRTPEPAPRDRRAIDEARSALEAAALQAPRLQIDAEHLAYLVGSGAVVDCGDGVLLAAGAYREAERRVTELLQERGNATLAEARDALQTNRRVTQALLETLDRRGVTRREGEGRVLRQAPAGETARRE